MRLILLSMAVKCLTIGLVFGDVKTWVKNTDFDDPNNWSGGGISCSNDKKSFPKNMKSLVYIQKNESLQELVLSDNMILTIAEGVSLTFNTDIIDIGNSVTVRPAESKQSSSSVTQQTPTTPKPRCTRRGRDVKFTAKPSSWFDPNSWSAGQITNSSKRFLLDLDKLPCERDRVVFPSENTFLADLESENIYISAMLVHNEELNSQAAFNNYWRGDISPYEFVKRPENTPRVGAWPPCGNDISCQCEERYLPEMKKSACRFMTCDEEKKCEKPIGVDYGQCCPLCGAKLMVKVYANEYKFPFRTFHNYVLEGLRPYDNIKYTFGHWNIHTFDLILIDDGDGTAASEVVCPLREFLLRNETSEAVGGIIKITFERSDGVDNCNQPGPSTAPQRKQPTKWDHIIIGVSLAFAVICILLILLGVFLYRKKYSVSGKNEMELGNVGSTRSSQGFDNPVYDAPLPYEDSFIVTYDNSEEQVNGFENALYTPGPEPPKSAKTKEKKTPLEDPYAPVVKKGKKKKSKEVKNLGFDNPVYAANKDEKKNEEGTGSMVSVPLDEDEHQLPDYVEHDGTGFANPIATGLSEEMMAPPLPRKEPITSGADSGFDNPLFTSPDAAVGGSAEAEVEVTPEITIHVATKKKKGKSGKSKDKKKNGTAVKDQGFGNPLYDQENEQQNFYQPETPGEDDSKQPEANDEKDL